MKQKLRDCNEPPCHVCKHKFTCIMLLTLDHSVLFCLLLSQWSFYNIYVHVNFIVCSQSSYYFLYMYCFYHVLKSGLISRDHNRARKWYLCLRGLGIDLDTHTFPKPFCYRRSFSDHHYIKSCRQLARPWYLCRLPKWKHSGFILNQKSMTSTSA